MLVALLCLLAPDPAPAHTVASVQLVASDSHISVPVVSGVGVAAPHTVVLALATSVEQVLTNIRNWLMGILAAVATVFATIGGVRYVLAGGDPGEVERAKTAFRSAGFGYVLAALAPLLITVLQGLVGG